jgi:hypothetical protein
LNGLLITSWRNITIPPSLPPDSFSTRKGIGRRRFINNFYTSGSEETNETKEECVESHVPFFAFMYVYME